MRVENRRRKFNVGRCGSSQRTSVDARVAALFRLGSSLVLAHCLMRLTWSCLNKFDFREKTLTSIQGIKVTSLVCVLCHSRTGS